MHIYTHTHIYTHAHTCTHAYTHIHTIFFIKRSALDRLGDINLYILKFRSQEDQMFKVSLNYSEFEGYLSYEILLN